MDCHKKWTQKECKNKRAFKEAKREQGHQILPIFLNLVNLHVYKILPSS